MSERLPATVICCVCRNGFPINKTRRLITLWARPGKGGSLSNIKDQHAEDRYRCDDCVRDGKFEGSPVDQEALL